jgi:hypothetical protein
MWKHKDNFLGYYEIKKVICFTSIFIFFLPKLSLSLQFIVKYGLRIAIVEPHGQQ